MNITPQNYSLPLPTAVNVQTDSLRRENHQREVIAKPEALNHSAAEKSVASDKERGRTPAQINEEVDFANLRKSAEQANSAIDDSQRDGQQAGSEGNANQQQNGEQQEASENQQSANPNEKSDAEVSVEQAQIRALEQRDLEVRNHERAHAAVGGSYTGSPTYSYETGPNGKRYAVEGEVSVDLTPIPGSPKETIAKMQKVKAAALAPAEPSAQDLRVAAAATSAIVEAQAEMSTESAKQAVEQPNDLFRDRRSFEQDDISTNEQSDDFDQLMANTLASQEAVSPSRSVEVAQRAGRIEQFYANINQAYEKPESHQFELIA